MKIRINASKCTSCIQGYSNFNNGMSDYWYYSDHTFETGRSYGLISEYKQGCMYLSYLIGGQIKFEDGLKIYLDDSEVSPEKLADISWNLEPSHEKYKDLIVRKAIEKALKNGSVEGSFEELAESFRLTPERYSCKLRQLSGERWSASAAVGYASGKKIFYAPYEPSNFYSANARLKNMIDYLTSHDCMVLLPVGSDMYIKQCVDQCIYIGQKTDWWKAVKS
ncbi:hypothetical protein SAMN02910456_01406 [Ruminococcaceae bacterium YRB3002]|nr:hypothetical protein SAMN02910456_01406 [Ruminococcaceae bacterium YRB3002]